jgi:ABC-type Na+ efflux pump permease subunit
MRSGRVIAVAKRDLAVEMRGKRGLVLPIIAAALLIPVSTIEFGGGTNMLREITVSGDVPAEVLMLSHTTSVPAGRVHFRQVDDVLLVETTKIHPTIRKALDRGAPVVTVSALETAPIRLPGRSLLFALISASILTAAVSASVAGERTRGTMETLLSSSLSRVEIVMGKWLAWSGFGAFTALAAALIATLFGRIEPGAWLIALPFVPAAAVAIGLYLVRRDARLVAGATVSLRVIPAVLSVSGVVSWVLGFMVSPVVGAAVPVGGALVAAGGVWHEPLPVGVALLSTTLTTLFLLKRCAKDLNRVPVPVTGKVGIRTIARTLLIMLPLWWVPLLAPLAWGPAGSPAMTAALSPIHATWAAGLALFTLLVLRAGSTKEPLKYLGLWRPTVQVWPILLGTLVIGLAPITEPYSLEWLQISGQRLQLGLNPSTVAGLFLNVIVVEIFARCTLVRQFGYGVALILFVVIFGLGNPLLAAVVGSSALAITAMHGGSVLPAIAMRLLAVPVSLFAAHTFAPIIWVCAVLALFWRLKTAFKPLSINA